MYLLSLLNTVIFCVLDIDTPKLNQSSVVSVNESDTISVSCSSVSLPPATFIWLGKDGRIVSNSSLLMFNRISRKNATSYTCKATNVVTTRSSQSLTIHVQCRLCLFVYMFLIVYTSSHTDGRITLSHNKFFNVDHNFILVSFHS